MALSFHIKSLSFRRYQNWRIWRKEIDKKFVFDFLPGPNHQSFQLWWWHRSSSPIICWMMEGRKEKRIWWLFQTTTNSHRSKEVKYWTGKAISNKFICKDEGTIEQLPSWLDGRGKIVFSFFPTFHRSIKDMRNTFDLWHSWWNWPETRFNMNYFLYQ